MTDQDLKAAFECCNPTQEQLDRMYRNICEGAPARKRRRFPHRLLRSVAVAAVVALCTVTGVAAYQGLAPEFRAYWNPDAAQEEQLAVGAVSIGKTLEASGGTLEVKQLLADENNIFVLMEFTAADESLCLNYDNYTFEVDTSVGDIVPETVRFSANALTGSGIGYGIRELEDDDPADNKISFMFCVYPDEPLTGKGSMTINAQALLTWVDGEKVLLAEGPWKVTVPLDSLLESRHWTFNEDVVIKDQTVQLSEVRISPISVYVTLDGENLSLVMDSFTEAPGGPEEMPVILHFKDGSQIRYDADSASISQGLDLIEDHFHIGYDFYETIDPDQVTAITLFDCTVELGG